MATTDSDHDNPIFPDLARDRIVDGPNQLWVADITYIAIATRFVSCPSSNGLGQSELFRDGGSGSFGFEIRRLSTDVSIVAV